MKKLSADQLSAVRETMETPGYKLIVWQQEMMLESLRQKCESTLEDHRFHQGRVAGAKEMLTAPDILLKKRSQ